MSTDVWESQFRALSAPFKLEHVKYGDEAPFWPSPKGIDIMSAHIIGNESPGHQNQEKADRAGLERARKRIISFRGRLYTRRLRLREQRTRLWRRQEALGESIDKIAGYVRQCQEESKAPESSFLDVLYTDLESKRNELGVLRYEYDQHEDDYERAERRLEGEEKALDRYIFGRGVGSDSDEAGTSGTATFDKTNIESEQRKDIEAPQRALAEYQFHLENLTAVRKHLRDLESEHMDKRRFVNMNRNANLGTSSSNEDFFESFERHKNELVAKHQASIQHVKQLGIDLTKHGYEMPQIDIFDPLSSELLQMLEPDPTALPIMSKPETPGGSSLIVAQPQHDLQVFISISGWIFKTLQSSPIERALHKAFLHFYMGREISDNQWAKLVIDHWSMDLIYDFGPLASSVDNIGWEMGARPMPQMLSSMGRAWLAIDQFDKQTGFVLSNSRARAPINTLQPKDHKSSYATDTLDMDVLGEYELWSL